MSNHNLEITPSNVLSNGKISFRNGNPIISFIIGEQDKLLIGRSVRLAGKFRLKMNETGTYEDRAKANDLAQAAAKLGVYGAIDQLVIKSQQSHQVIEHIKYYNRFMASYLPQSVSTCDQTSHLSESALVMPNANLFKQSVLDNPTQTQSPNSFCVPLSCGLLNGTANIPLSSNWGLKGLLIEIHLAPDTNFIFAGVQQGPLAQAEGSTSTLVDSFYELSDVKLVCETIDPTPEQLRAFPTSGGTFEYNSISTYFTSINSSNAIINFNLGLKRVMGVFMNFIPSEFLNNLSFDGFQTTPLINNLGAGELAPIKQIVFTKGGVRLPLMYNLDTNARSDTATYKSVIADPEVTRGFMGSFVPFMKNHKTQQSPITNNRVAFDSNTEDFADGGSFFGVGTTFDNISGEGVDFRNENFGVQMETALTADNPHSAFLYVRSKQTLVMNANGLQVIQ